MPHEAWHVIVLSTTLIGAGALALVVLAPLLFDETPPGLVRARPFLAGLIALALVALLAEWLGAH